MTAESSHGPLPYRVTLFFGPEPAEEGSDIQVCVFNVKRRSWKAGIQVSVEVANEQLDHLRHAIQFTDWIAKVLMSQEPEERQAYDARAREVFVQAVAWCKLDLCLAAGMTQEHQRILATEFLSELDHAVVDRTEYVRTYIISELDLVSDYPSS